MEGRMAKIEDIGPLAKVIAVDGDEIELELEGERFWMPARLVRIVE